MDICEAGPIAEETELHEDERYGAYYDDVNGGILPTELVEQARKLERDWIDKEGVYVRVPKEQMEADGMQAIPLLWIDTNKGDSENVFVRSRLVVREAT